MRRVAIYGAGGFGKEVRGMLEQQPVAFGGFLDDFKEVQQSVVAISFDDVVLGIADPLVRKNLVTNWKLQPVSFNSLISRDIFVHDSVKVARGCILCPGVKMTVDITLGQFVIINLNSTIGHDVEIGDFSSIMPSVNISGNVRLGEGVYVGSGACILQGITIGNYATIGAGAVVTHNVDAGKRVIGIPAKEMDP